jgi:short-chain fatty acids transporter
MKVDQRVPARHERNGPGVVARLAIAMTAWTERWLPDAFIFALVFTLVVIGGAVALTPSTLVQAVDAWGRGFWDLIPFTLQMALVVITGHVLASSRPMARLIQLVATWPSSPRAAVAFVALVAMGASWLHWGFSLMFSALLAREVARRVDGVDYRALAAASYMGMGSIWAQGLSGSAVLQMASAGALQPQISAIVAHDGLVPGGLIPFRHTIFLWQNIVAVLAEIVAVTVVMWLATPPRGHSRTARELGIDLGEGARDDDAAVSPDASRPGTWLEHSTLLTWTVGALGIAYLVRYFMQSREPLNAINLNTLNLAFLIAGFLLHRTPARLMRAVAAATPAVWGILLQFPFYAGIAGVIVATHLNDRIAAAFVDLSTPTTFPAVVAIYSAVLGVLVPSGGSKWVIEAPYVMAAAHALHVHLGWVVNAYGLGEALANLVQPFFMLPILGVLGLSARDIMGYTVVVCLTLTPVVIGLLLLLGRTLAYPL